MSLWTVYRLRQQMKQTGSVDLRVNQRGRKAKLTRQDLDAVNDPLNKQPALSIREIKERLHLNVCEETVRKAVIKLGYRVKKKSIHASEHERSRCESKATPLERTQVKSSDEPFGLSGRERCQSGDDTPVWPCCRRQASC